MESDQLTLARAITARCQTNATRPECGKTLHMGMFFDGFARNLETDLTDNRASNIGKLFLAHRVDSSADAGILNVYRKAYLTGLGAPYDASAGTQASGALNRGQSGVMNIPGDVAGDQALEAAKDSLSGRSWWQRLSRDLRQISSKPQNALKVFKNTAINTAAELIEPIRDSRWAAHLVKSGADVRLEGAFSELNTTISGIQGGAPLRQIKISVFGFDFGATLARAFVHELIARSQQRASEYYYRNAKLEIVFAGLFDAVDRSAAELPPLEFFLPVTNAMEDGGLIHPHVKSVLHVVAAHERRFYRRARLLGEHRRNWREELMPGVSEDVGGGLAPGEQKASNELATVSLHNMYRAAFSAGSALIPMDELPAKGRMIASLFTFNDRSPSQRSAYALVRHYHRIYGRQVPGRDAFILHMRIYIRWLANIWAAYQLELANLQRQEDGIASSSSFPLSGIFGVAGTSSAERRERDTIQGRRRELGTEFRWLEAVDSEAKSMLNRARAHGWRAAGTREGFEVWRALLGEWFDPKPLEPEVAELFSFFVHDQQVLSAANRSARSLSGENFFSIRGYDRPRGSLPADKRA